MRFTHALTVIALFSAPFTAGTAMAGEPLNLTPPLYREQARTIRQTRAASDMITTPQPVAAAKPVEARRVVEVVAEASAAR